MEKRSLKCRFGFHNWYNGSYSHPVWGRHERRCMDCTEKQYRSYKPLKWNSYKMVDGKQVNTNN